MELKGNIKNPRTIVIGCFHGDEPQGKFLIDEYLKLVDKTEILFVPCLNAYGYANNVRTNEHGVDLNRNFPTKNWIKTSKDEFFGGEIPASEKETQFIINLVEKYEPKIILTLHAPFKIVNYDGPYDKIVEEISKIISYPVEKSVGYPTPGSFGTWAGIENQILTITLELDEKIDMIQLKKPVFEIFNLLEGI